MRRDQVEHAIRAACQIIGRSEVIVVGSQAILVDPGVIAERLVTVDERYRAAVEPATRWVVEVGK